jgi:hypothetical protein
LDSKRRSRRRRSRRRRSRRRRSRRRRRRTMQMISNIHQNHGVSLDFS